MTVPVFFEGFKFDAVRMDVVFFEEHADGVFVLDTGICPFGVAHVVSEVVEEDVGYVF